MHMWTMIHVLRQLASTWGAHHATYYLIFKVVPEMSQLKRGGLVIALTGLAVTCGALYYDDDQGMECKAWDVSPTIARHLRSAQRHHRRASRAHARIGCFSRSRFWLARGLRGVAPAFRPE